MKSTWNSILHLAGVLVIGVLFVSGSHFSMGQPAEGPGPQPITGSPEAPQAAPVVENVPESADSDSAEQKSVIPTNPTEMVAALKFWIVPFGMATLIAVWFSTERFVVLRRGRVIPKPFVERFLQHLKERSLSQEEALNVCEENNSPVAQIFAHGVRKWGKPSVEVEQAIIDGGERQINQLRKHLRVLNGVATVCPLIGLLGTVWGMIEAFNGIAQGNAMGSPEKLAAGIALALLTTAAGLVIAIPAMIVSLYFAGRIDRLVMDMDSKAQQVVYSISAEALAEPLPAK